MKAALGILIVAAHAAGFVALARHATDSGLAVTIAGPAASPTFALQGTVPAAIRARVHEATEGSAPGLVRATWSVAYRGGYTRSVGATQLVGPVQDPDAHACLGRVIVGQQLLDDGKASAGTIAHEVAKTIDAEIAGTSITGLGSFRRSKGLRLRWARFDKHPEDLFLVGATLAYLRVSVTLVFDRVEVPLVIAMIPHQTATELTFKIVAHASLDFDNRVAQWISDKVGGDQLATRFARRALDGAVLAALAPPPPIEVPDEGGTGTTTVAFTYCNGPIEVGDGAYAALPFGVQIHRVGAAPTILPPHRGPGPRPAPAADTKLALDLDVDALNALLYELWRTGYLDRRLRDAGIDTRFAADPIVQEYLSLRISPPVLALPPVLEPRLDGSLRLGADTRITIADGSHTAVGRVWTALDLHFGGSLPIGTTVGDLQLACEASPQVLTPCYADLVEAVRGRKADFDAQLYTMFSDLLGELFADQTLGDASVPATLVIHGARPTLITSPRTAQAATNATLRLVLDAVVAPP